MDRDTTITRGMKRRVWTYGLAALLVLASTPAQAEVADGSAKSGMAIGLTPGQRLRVTAYNDGIQLVAGDKAAEGSEDGGSLRPDGTIEGYVKVLNAQGGILFQTEHVRILPGGFHAFDVDRHDLPLAGEPRTGRLQVRVKFISTVLADGAPGQGEAQATVKVASSFELIEKRSGQTTMHTEFTSVLSLPGF